MKVKSHSIVYLLNVCKLTPSCVLVIVTGIMYIEHLLTGARNLVLPTESDSLKTFQHKWEGGQVRPRKHDEIVIF